MAKLAEWFDSFTQEIKQSPEYKTEAIAMDIALRVYDRLKEYGLKQKDLAERLGVHKSYVSQILSGKPNMTIETLVKLSESLEMNLDINLVPKEKIDLERSIVIVSTTDIGRWIPAQIAVRGVEVPEEETTSTFGVLSDIYEEQEESHWQEREPYEEEENIDAAYG